MLTDIKDGKNDSVIHRTFRFEREAMEILEQESKERRQSENSIVNQLILKNLKAERIHRRLREVHLHAMTARALLEETSDEKIIEVATSDANDPVLKNIFVEVGGIFSADSILDKMKLFYDVSWTEHDGRKIVIVAHFGGRKYSLLIGTMFENLFKLTGKEVDLAIDENAVVLSLSSKV